MPYKREIVVIIPARGGSKGLPGKNIRLLAGIPLVAHSILDARESKYVTRVYVSTDDSKIGKIARQYGAEIVKRPKVISGDKASSESALIHALSVIEKDGVRPDLVVFLQCTSPIRTGKDIDQAIEELDRKKLDSIFSGTLSHRFIWESNGAHVSSINYDYRRRPRRQDMLPQYLENGSVYVFKPQVLKKYSNRMGGKVGISEMDYWGSFEIDTLADFELCEWILRNAKKESGRA